MNTAILYYHKPKRVAENVPQTAFPDNGINVKSAAAPVEKCRVPEASIFNCTANTLRGMGLTGKYDGFLYICKAVEAILKSDEPPHFQNLYFDIGKAYGVNSSSVERSIRYAIRYIRRAGNEMRRDALFGTGAENEKNYANSRFLTILAADVFQKLTLLETEEVQPTA